MGFSDTLKRLSYSKTWIGFFIIFGLFLIYTGDEKYQIAIGLFSLGMAGYQSFRYLKRKKNPKNTHATALDFLKERYAKGEISKDEYYHIRKDIEN